MTHQDREIVRAAAEIRLRISKLIQRAAKDRPRQPLAWFLDRSPLECFWHFPQSVWLASIAFNVRYNFWQFDVARVSTAGDGITRQSREVIAAKELYRLPPAVCLHPFESAIDRCLDYFRGGAEHQARADFYNAALGVPFDRPGGVALEASRPAPCNALHEVQILLDGAIGQKARSAHEQDEQPKRINFREFL